MIVGDAGMFCLDPGVLRSVMREALAEPVAERMLSDFRSRPRTLRARARPVEDSRPPY